MGRSRGKSILSGYAGKCTGTPLLTLPCVELVLSFISSLGGSKHNATAKENKKSSSDVTLVANLSPFDTPHQWQTPPTTPSPPTDTSPGSSGLRVGNGSRPASMIFSRNPPLMQQAVDTPPELSPIFSFLNIHSNKVYQEGYFLKLNDLDSRKGNPTPPGRRAGKGGLTSGRRTAFWGSAMGGMLRTVGRNCSFTMGWRCAGRSRW